jgi:predicted nucleic acid-binding protein
MYLLDTNIILEVLLDQERAAEAEQLLHNTSPEELYLSDFSLYSLGIILLHRKEHDAFLQLVDDLTTGGIGLVSLGAERMPDVIHAAQQFNLDFDDAYQYAVAESYDLAIVSFDGDFDRTERGRQTPIEILAG